MANGFLVVNKDSWEDSSPEQRNAMVYDTLQSIDKRLKAIEKRPFIDKVYSFAGGVIGGILAFFGAKIGG